MITVGAARLIHSHEKDSEEGMQVPKVVDQEARRRDIAEAVFRVIGDSGMEGASLRDVADEAGVSMGTIQHYFGSKDKMLLFALGHLQQRAGLRFAAHLTRLPNPTTRHHLRAILRVLLPTDKQSRQEATVNIAFFSVANSNRRYREILRDGYSQLLALVQRQLVVAEKDGELGPGTDTERESANLFYATQGLIGPVLLGILSGDQALAILDHQLDRLFLPAFAST